MLNSQRTIAAFCEQSGWEERSQMPTCTVKWFNDAKRFGFIVPDDGDEDLFVHFSEIQAKGFKSLQEKSERSSFDVKLGPKGKRAANTRSH
jgi:CspA family cold shock protein